MCPPGTDTAIFATSMRGPFISLRAILSRTRESTLRTPPTVLTVVQPLRSSVRAYDSHMRSTAYLVTALLMSSRTSLALSVCFFLGFPDAGRWMCRLMRPGRR